MTARRFAVVALIEGALVHHDRLFTYSIPDGMAVEVGSVVRAPVRGKRTRGVVVELLEQPDVERTAPLAAVVGVGLTGEDVDLARWLAGRYLSTLGEALAAIVPERVASEERAETRPPTVGPAPAGDDLLSAYDGGVDLLDAVRAGRASAFVLRPATDHARARLIAEITAVARGTGAGVLVVLPEVGSGSDVARVLAERSGDAIAWVGSDRTARDRYRGWLALRRGVKPIGVGGRAAVFAPVGRLGLIVVDDEGHPAYKEGRAPRFHVRTVAAERARRAGVPLVLIGSPPSVDAMVATESGSVRLVSPPRAMERAARPAVTVIDLTKVDSRLMPSSQTLGVAARAIADGKRVALLAHRGAEEVRALADRVGRALKTAVATLDTATSPAALRTALAEAQAVIATPVIAKDLPLQDVGLLAIVGADAPLTQPNLRAAEETFATWWRAARWAMKGTILIETATPSHPAVRALTRWDPDVLWRAEATRRKELGYPPFASVARVDTTPDRVEQVMRELAAAGVDVLGPVERDGTSVVVARAKRRDDLLARLGPVVTRWRAADEPMRVDVDPWEVLEPRWRS